MDRLRSWPRALPLLALLGSLSAFYLRTLAPGLTWANHGSDGGDLIAAAATGGVAHPTGYPLYLILAGLVQHVPVGSLAFRTNLMSAIATVLAAVLVYKIVTRAVPAASSEFGWCAGLGAGYSFGLAPLIWSQAVITEVYALQGFLIVLILYLYTKPAQSARVHQIRLDRWRGLVLGLATCNHVTTLLLLPAALLSGSIHNRPAEEEPPGTRKAWFRTLKFHYASAGRQFAYFALGLSLYLVLPLRARASPPVNWGNAVTPGGFWWLISGQLYQSYYLQFNLPDLVDRLQACVGLLIGQVGLPGLVIGLSGLTLFSSASRLYGLTIWLAAISLAFTIFYRSADSHLYLIPLVICFAIWIGLGIGGGISWLSSRLPILGWGFALVLIGYFVARSAIHRMQVDASQDRRAEEFGMEVLAAAPKDALIFARGDQAVFSLWYYHFALGERPDLAVLATDLLHFDWYQENLRSNYPALRVPGLFPWPETIALANPERQICYVEYTNRTEIDCSQPLALP